MATSSGGGNGGGGPAGGSGGRQDELATVQESRRKWYNPAWVQDLLSLGYQKHNEEGIPNRSFRVLNCIHRDHPGEETYHFPGNSVSTAKYTSITFIPRALFEQFRRLANVYFLVITVLMMLGTYTTLFDSPLTPYTTLIPLIIVLAITMGKEGFEDIKRHTADLKTNNRETRLLSLTTAGDFETVYWKNVKVGRIVKVTDREEIPADLLLLTSSELGGICYVETANIDGETNLKVKQAAYTDEEGNGPAFRTPEDLHDWDAELECEAPNSRIHFFTGTIHWKDRSIAVDQANLLLRGSQLRNTKWILGLVIYTGYETKIVMNSRVAPSKLSTIERTTNRLLYLILGTQVILVTVALVAYLVWTSANESELTYLCYDYSSSTNSFYADNCEESDDTSDLGMWLTFLCLFNNFVPISLYVTVEMVNYFQALMIDQDRAMYDEESDTPAMARTSNMNGDLGSVRYVFSDKTGTLTQNVMKFMRCSVAGDVFGNLEGAGRRAGGGKLVEDEKPVVQGLALSELSLRSQSPDSAYFYFNEILSVCHTVVVESNQETGEKDYQGESPDEEALVEAARDLQWEFVGRIPTEAYIFSHGKSLTYKILAVIPFSSTRKRMSVVVRTPEKKIVLMTKGADNVIFDRSQGYLDTTRETLDDHLSVFAADGLRTLVLARKEISEQDFQAWFTKFRQASTAIGEDRIERITAVSEEIEGGLTVVGATAIEDKLQDGVPDTIAHLLQAGVKVWVLTGDKMETAVNIGYSCRLLNSSMVLIKVTHQGREVGALREQLQKLVSHFERLVEDETLLSGIWEGGSSSASSTPSPPPRPPTATTTTTSAATDLLQEGEKRSSSSLPEPLLDPQPDAPAFENLATDHLALIIDGPALAKIFGDGEMERLLLRIATLCKSVVACRVSPAQKRMLVRLVKKGMTPKPMTLAIGDGANDVAMIQEAQIGVGISGKEGRQAVNSSDFAIAQFRFLEPLMLKHGRWNYRRISKVILYSFYKNIVLTMVLFYFTWWTGFSGQSLFQDYVYTGYNFFLAMPIICCGIFDRDVSPSTIARFRWVYMSGRENMDLNLENMAHWLLQAMIDSVLIYFLCYGALNIPREVIADRGYGDDLYILGLIIYTCMLMAMLYKAGTITYTWTWVNWFFYIGSLLLDYVESFYWVPYQMFSRGFFWLMLLLVPTVSVIIDYIVIHTRLAFYPSPIDIAIEYDRYHAKKQAAEQEAEAVEEEEDGRNPNTWWVFGGKLVIGAEILKRLNATASELEKSEMGIRESRGRLESSYDYSATSVDLGPGAGARPDLSQPQQQQQRRQPPEHPSQNLV